MAQFQAGYYTDRLFAFWQKHIDKEKVEGLLNLLSRFEADLPDPAENNFSADPVLAVARNLILRGLPTRTSVAVEEVLADVLGRTERIDDHGKLSFKATTSDNNFEKALYRALHVIDPRVQSPNDFEPFGEWHGKTDVGYEDNFFQSILPTFLGSAMLQLVEVQRPATTIIENQDALKQTFDELYEHSQTDFSDEVIDFTFQMPFKIKGVKGMMIEFDNVDHATYPRRDLDEALEEVAHDEGWESTLRIDDDRYADFQKHMKPLQHFLATGYYDFHKQNYELPLYRSEEGLDALQVALTPFAVARIQRTILELIKNGNLSLDDPEWHFAFIERDVPCAHLAMLDLHQLLKHLFVLHGEGLGMSNMQSVPDIRMDVYHTADFNQAKLNKAMPGSKLLAEFDSDQEYTLLFDVSVLQRKGIRNAMPKHRAKDVVTIRSAHSILTEVEYEVHNPIEYETIYKDNPLGELKFHPKSLEALTYLTQSIFRKTGLRQKQLEMLDPLLQRKSCAGLLPPGVGKSMVYQLAALLQPAPSIVITPLMTLAKNQMDGLWSQGIHRMHWLNAALNTEQSVREAIGEFETRVSLFNFVAPEWFRKNELRESIAFLEEKKQYFAYCIIDEAHCCSEWSHDFRQEYFMLPQLTRALLSDCAMVGLSGTAFNNTIFDIQTLFAISDATTITDTIPAERFDSEVELVDLPKTRNAAIFSMAKGLLANRKQVRALQFASDLSQKSEKVFFFTPYTKGVMGITDNNKDGLADKLKFSFGEQRVSAFVGTDRNYSTVETEEIDTENIAESKEAYNTFTKSEADIVVSSSALAVGIDSENFQNIIHLNLPASIESFVQKNGRGNRNGAPTKSVILYNNQKFKRIEERVKIDEQGKEEVVSNEVETTIDKQILRDFHYSRFRGRKFDLESAFELLDGIHQPDFSPKEELIKQLERKFDLSFSMIGHAEEEPKRMLLFANRRDFALFRFEDGIKHILLGYEVEQADLIIEDVQNFFRSSPSKDIYTWFFAKNKQPKLKGIDALLQEFERSQKIFAEYEKPRLKIPFENDRIERITELLLEHSSELFTEEMVLEAFQYSLSAKDFIANLHRTANVQVVGEGINLPKRLNDMFYEIRRRENTLTAVRQLATLGIIEDFLIDDDKRQLDVTLSPVSNEYFVIALYRYAERYVAKEEAYKVFSDIYKYKEKSVLRQSVRYIIDFVYDEIAPSRYHAIEAMADACEETVNPDAIEGDVRFGDLIQLNLQSKYAHPAHTPNLVDDTKNFSEYNYSFLKNYIDISGAKRENWYHLQGSSEMLLKKHPGNYLLMMLKAYSRFALSPTDLQANEKALFTITQALEKARASEQWTVEELNAKIQEIAEWITNAVPSLKKLKYAIAMKIHLLWLREFNKSFLEGYSK